MNVLEYFRAKLPEPLPTHERDLEILAEMPLDSNCGDSCKNTIDAAAAFLVFNTEAYGDGIDSRLSHWKGKDIRQRVGLSAMHICICFIRG